MLTVWMSGVCAIIDTSSLYAATKSADNRHQTPVGECVYGESLISKPKVYSLLTTQHTKQWPREENTTLHDCGMYTIKLT